MPKQETKTVSAYALVDWKDGSVRCRQTKPKRSAIGTNELLAELKFDVRIPDIEVPTLAAEIEVPEPMVHSATLEALDDEDLPDWTDTVDRILGENDPLVAQANAGEIPLDDLENWVVLETLREDPGRPPIDLVEEYVSESVRELLGLENSKGADQ